LYSLRLIENASGDLCKIYSIVHVQNEVIEFDTCAFEEFFSHFENKPEYTEALDIITEILILIATEEGPKEKFFRFENDAFALPSPNNILKELGLGLPEQNLRLFVLKLSENAIIILGGGDKGNHRSAQESNTSAKFYEAQKIAKSILRLKTEGDLQVDENGDINQIEDIIF